MPVDAALEVMRQHGGSASLVPADASKLSPLVGLVPDDSNSASQSVSDIQEQAQQLLDSIHDGGQLTKEEQDLPALLDSVLLPEVPHTTETNQLGQPAPS